MTIEISLALLALAVPLTAIIIKVQLRPRPQNGNSPVTKETCKILNGHLHDSIIEIKVTLDQICKAMNSSERG